MANTEPEWYQRRMREDAAQDGHSMTVLQQHLRIKELEAALRGLVNHWNEFGDMMGMKDDYGLSERMDAAAKLIEGNI